MNISRCFAFSSVLLLAACGDSVPEATDEQLVSLLGEHEEAYGQPLPPRILSNTEDCVRLLAGLEDEIVQDIPDEYLGRIKADCRTDLRDRLQDSELNPMGIELSHFENRELGERVSELAQPSREAARQARNEAREAKQKADAEAREAEQQAKIDEAQEKIATLQSSLDDRLEEFAQLCAEFMESRQSALDQDITVPSHLRWSTPSVCKNNFTQRLSSQVENVSERLAALEPGSGMFGPSIPYFGMADAEYLDAQKEDLESKVQEINQLLSE
ncbi:MULTISPECIES: hypothetical protein [unclassified Halomonas]|uniref:hypothetical protein n=1 Tax=unclassified Halomonas TaxID=2609666 RepID=UPI001CF480E9|nr:MULTISPECIES: hypothetical protein [unclassified Halomonas]MCA8864370.1 hypothetical protein [Halomonas sp. SBBP1]UZH10017.1 hypothetical protein OM794_22290 [Halomonas sp. BDJS001]